jgi:hypothetical protein
MTRINLACPKGQIPESLTTYEQPIRNDIDIYLSIAPEETKTERKITQSTGY